MVGVPTVPTLLTPSHKARLCCKVVLHYTGSSSSRRNRSCIASHQCSWGLLEPKPFVLPLEFCYILLALKLTIPRPSHTFTFRLGCPAAKDYFVPFPAEAHKKMGSWAN